MCHGVLLDPVCWPRVHTGYSSCPSVIKTGPEALVQGCVRIHSHSVGPAAWGTWPGECCGKALSGHSTEKGSDKSRASAGAQPEAAEAPGWEMMGTRNGVVAAEMETAGVTSIRGGETNSCHDWELTIFLTLLFQAIYLYQINSHKTILQSRFVDRETEAQSVEMTHSRQYSWREGQLGLEPVPLSMTLSQGWRPDSTPHLGSAQQRKTQKGTGHTERCAHGAVKHKEHVKDMA